MENKRSALGAQNLPPNGSCACVRECVCARMYVCVCTCLCARACVCAHVCAHARVCPRVCGGLFACTCGGQGWGHPRVHELLGGGQWLPVGLGFSGQSPEKFLATAGTGDGGSKPATGQQHGRIPAEPCGPSGGTQLVATVRNDEQVASMPKETENRSQRGHVRSRAEAPPEDRVRRTTSSVHVCGGEGRPTRGRPRTRRAARTRPPEPPPTPGDAHWEGGRRRKGKPAVRAGSAAAPPRPRPRPDLRGGARLQSKTARQGGQWRR